MTESKALVLFFAIFAIVVASAYIGLTALDATSDILVACLLLIACAGALISSGVVMHYAPPDERHR